MASGKDKPLMRALGEFFGEVWKGVTTDPAKPGRVTRRRVEQRVENTPEGRVILRRTTVEEIIVPGSTGRKGAGKDRAS